MEKINPAISFEPPAHVLHQNKIEPSLADLSITSNGVRALGTDEYKGAAACLADAFANDDVAMYFIDTPDRQHWTAQQKWDLHVSTLEFITYAHCLKGLVTTCGPNYGSVALW